MTKIVKNESMVKRVGKRMHEEVVEEDGGMRKVEEEKSYMRKRAKEKGGIRSGIRGREQS